MIKDNDKKDQLEEQEESEETESEGWREAMFAIKGDSNPANAVAPKAK